MKELERLEIKSPTGKATWPKTTIDVMLSNEKYTGNVHLLDNGKHDAYYRAENNNPVIISKETFQAVQIEKQHRTMLQRAKKEASEKAKNTVQRSKKAK